MIVANEVDRLRDERWDRRSDSRPGAAVGNSAYPCEADAATVGLARATPGGIRISCRA